MSVETVRKYLSEFGVPVYFNGSLRRFASVFPAAGSPGSAVELTRDELFRFFRAKERAIAAGFPKTRRIGRARAGDADERVPVERKTLAQG